MEFEMMKIMAIGVKKYIDVQEHELKGQKALPWQQLQDSFSKVLIPKPVLSPSSLNLQELIGEGGFGSVVGGYFGNRNQRVAVKKMADNCEVGRNETALLKLCHCQGVVKLLGHFMIDKAYYIVFEEARGTAADLCKVTGSMEINCIVKMATQVLEALKYVHRKKVIHRDIKMDNILIVGNQFKLCDFGIAIEVKEGLPFKDNLPNGTPGKMAPESVKKLEYYYESDLFAVGVMIYESFMGRAMFILDDPLNSKKYKGQLTADWIRGRLQALANSEIFQIATVLLAETPRLRAYDRQMLDLCNKYNITNVFNYNHPLRVPVRKRNPCPLNFFPSLQPLAPRDFLHRELVQCDNYYLHHSLLPNFGPRDDLLRQIKELGEKNKTIVAENAARNGQVLAASEAFQRQLQDKEAKIDKLVAENASKDAEILARSEVGESLQGQVEAKEILFQNLKIESAAKDAQILAISLNAESLAGKLQSNEAVLKEKNAENDLLRAKVLQLSQQMLDNEKHLKDEIAKHIRVNEVQKEDIELLQSTVKRYSEICESNVEEIASCKQVIDSQKMKLNEFDNSLKNDEERQAQGNKNQNGQVKLVAVDEIAVHESQNEVSVNTGNKTDSQIVESEEIGPIPAAESQRNHENSSRNVASNVLAKKSKRKHKAIEANLSKKDKEMACKVCQKVFINKSNRVRHEASHGKKRLKCEFCNEEFIRSDYLQDHTRREHLKIKGNACKNCGKTFYTHSQLYQHNKNCPKKN